MIDDFENEFVNKQQKINATSDQYYLKQFNLDEEQRNETIISMSTSKKYIYFLTESHNLFVVDSVTLKTISESYSLPSPKEKSDFKEKNFNKIWPDREGNHCIIRHNNSIYYFNNSLKEAFELEQFKTKEICAVALDDKNTEIKTTKNFLAVDYNNTIYECCIEVTNEGKNKKIKIKDKIEELITLNQTSDEESSSSKRKHLNDRIYGMKFFHSIVSNIDQNEDGCYIIAVSKNKLYQFRGPGLKSFKQIFSRYDGKQAESFKYFPENSNIFDVQFDILYKIEKTQNTEILSEFGWRTYTGYCYSNFEYEKNNRTYLPSDFKNFTIIPFQKITDKGKKEKNLNPISVVQSPNHIFILYDDCLTVISKLSSNIIHTQYFNTKFDQMLYHEFSKDNGIILLNSKNGLYQISLKEENRDIWKDYLELGDFKSASKFCNSDKMKDKIRRINADEEFNKNRKESRKEAAEIYANSDEKFEIVCLKYLKEKDLEGLKYYLECYKKANLKSNNDEENKENENQKDKCLQLNLINTWIIEIILHREKLEIKDFMVLVRENKKYIYPDIIYQTLLNYGKAEEYLTFASIFGHFERATVYNINQGQIKNAIEQLKNFAIFDDTEVLKALVNIFLEYSHLFFKEDPKGSIELLNEFLNNNIEINEKLMENTIQALMSRTDKDNINAKNKKDLIPEKKKEYTDNIKTILGYLKSLTEPSGQNKFIKSKIKEQLNNIHNLYIYYLSINPANKLAVIEYLKKYLEIDQRGKRKQKVLFQLDYAKRILKDNKLAYALVLALMGKYSEGVSYALKKESKEENMKYNLEIAEYIADSALDKKLKKKLWIEIFRSYSENITEDQNSKKEEKFNKALEIMEKSKILKIEDVLPHITDSVKIEEFQTQISKCISQYEENINGLKNNIKTYNNIAENIKTDINKIKKRSMEIKYNEFKCEICKGYIKNKNIFLFPCGHMFDMDCIRECLLNYEITGLDYLHDDNVLIDKMSYDLGLISKRVFVEKDTGNKNEDQKKGENKLLTGLFKKLKLETNEKQKEDTQLIEEDDKKELRKVLNDYLSKQCVLCGDFLVDSVQCSLNQRKKNVDSYGLKLTLQGEPDFMF